MTSLTSGLVQHTSRLPKILPWLFFDLLERLALWGVWYELFFDLLEMLALWRVLYDQPSVSIG